MIALMLLKIKYTRYSYDNICTCIWLQKSHLFLNVGDFHRLSQGTLRIRNRSRFREYHHPLTPLRCGTNRTEVLDRSYFETEMYWDRYLCI